MRYGLLLLWISTLFAACEMPSQQQATPPAPSIDSLAFARDKLQAYAILRLNPPPAQTWGENPEVLPHLVAAASLMDSLFWRQSYGQPGPLLAQHQDSAWQALLSLNYGPYDRLRGNEPLLANLQPKAPGAQFYPANFSQARFAELSLTNKAHPYTLIRRNEDRKWLGLPYHEAYRPLLQACADHLREAASKTHYPSLRSYLDLLAQALLSDHFEDSEIEWLSNADTPLDLVMGPIETYEDKLLGYKAAYQACILLRDESWTEKIQAYNHLLPRLQQILPLQLGEFVQEPLSPDKLGVYDVIFASGLFNAGSKSMGLNAPAKPYPGLGKRRLLFKNVIEAKFSQILQPLSDLLIDSAQRKWVNYEAFFSYTLFHEMAHGLGVTRTESGQSVHETFRQQANILEEGKGDILSLYMISYLHDQGQWMESPLEAYYTTFLASVLRSMRFGAASAHGRANMMRFQFFLEAGAFVYAEDTRTYGVDMSRMHGAILALAQRILQLQRAGDVQAAINWIRTDGQLRSPHRENLANLDQLGIPIDLQFDQSALHALTGLK